MPTEPRDPSSRARRGAAPNGDPAGADDFWGASRSWTEVPAGKRVRSRRDAEHHAEPNGSRVGRWWNSIVAGGTTAHRSHGTRSRDVASDSAARPARADDVTPAVGIDPFLDPDIDPATIRHADTRPVPIVEQTSAGYGAHGADEHDWDVDAWHDDAPAADSTIDAGAGGPHGDDWDGDWDVEPVPVRGGVDPLLLRFGAAAVALTVAVPVILGFTSGSDSADQLQGATAEATTEVVEAPSSDAATATIPSTSPASTGGPAASTSAAAESTAASTSAAPSTAATTTAGAVQQSAALEAPTTVDVCASEYELAEGDYWIRIADASGVRLSELLTANDATINSVLVPGRSICLPAGATAPGPPPAPSTAGSAGSGSGTGSGSTTPPATTPPTTPPTTAAPTTAAPTTTAPATTTPPSPPPPPVSTGEVVEIIRDVWPDELEDKALAIAWRESNYQPTAKNSCCYGLFQIYWSVHRSWLGSIGVTSADQLFDPATNARAAYALYQRSGGWGPWGG